MNLNRPALFIYCLARKKIVNIFHDQILIYYTKALLKIAILLNLMIYNCFKCNNLPVYPIPVSYPMKEVLPSQLILNEKFA